jgi:hypothetical protein
VRRSVILLVLSFVVVLWLSLTAVFSYAGLRALQAQEFSSAAWKLRAAHLLYSPIDLTLGRVSPDLDAVSSSLALAHASAKLAESLQRYLPDALVGNTTATSQVPQLQQHIRAWNTQFQIWVTSYSDSSLLQRIVLRKAPAPFIQELLSQPESLKSFAQSATQVIDDALVGEHRYIAVLQNSDELRATGGFMGSYASLELRDGVIYELAVQDIYQPDGQFTGFVEPPPGAKEFLSGGKGLRLPDSNWNPDFPLSAQDIMQFFALGKETQVEGVIAINLQVAEQLIAFVGPIYLPDYGQSVTAENLSSLARADRSQFFPGSQQKRQFLQALLVQLKLKLAEEIPGRPDEFIELLRTEATRKHIQLYAKSPHLQKLSEQLSLTGQILTYASPRYFFPVESNVGINKANRKVSRQVSLMLTPQLSNFTIDFQNENPPLLPANERGDYINYQRIFVPSSYRVHQLVVNGVSLGNWDEKLVKTAANESLKQVGFLVSVPAQSSASAQIIFAHPDILTYNIVLQHQSGLSPTPYHIETPSKVIDLLIEQDVTLSLD